MAARKLAALFAAVLHLCLCQQATEVLPEFLAPLENHTVVQGRDIFFTCVVNHLQTYKVAWLKSDTRAILAIHTHMVAHNSRFSVTHNGHNTWKLHVSNVQKNDSGTYMCQVNTDPMRSQMGYMEVHIPPDIADDESANDLVTPEGGNVRLKCVATGYPAPTVTWRREDGRNITLRENGQKKSAKTYEGEILELTNVMRQEMGTYLCIATNNVPPTISKRYSVDVHFPPLVKAVNQLVITPLNSNVVIQCYVEACPRAMNTWHRDKGEKLVPSKKHVMTEQQICGYSWQMNLTINMVNRTDLGGYFCSAENAIGRSESAIRLQKMHVEVSTTSNPNTKNVESKSRDKPTKNKKTSGKNSRPYGAIKNGENELRNGDDGVGTTQVMVGSTVHEGQRTDRPFVMPSLSPPWVSINAAYSTHYEFHYTTILLLFFLPSAALTF